MSFVHSRSLRSVAAPALLSLGLVVTLPAPPVAASPTAASVPSRPAPSGALARAVVVPAVALPILRTGDRGSLVKLVQRKLKVKPRSGLFGPMTRKAVKRFQRAHGLPAVGQVGPQTWAALRVRASGVAAKVAAPAARPAASGSVCPVVGSFSYGDGFGAGRGDHSHQGIDLMGSRGQTIVAVEAGTVIRAGKQSNGALRIVLQGQSGSKYYYGHNSKHLVAAGASVTAGQPIALMGDTGSPGAVHLHFEYWQSGGESDAVDPAPLVRSSC
ncbi:MAG: hypothetical protein EPO13_02685 [Actinomycetota bacterium]|nr:MAG: hypothetical protein EPO13_02685 [Actinomycetota bacterium]